MFIWESPKLLSSLFDVEGSRIKRGAWAEPKVARVARIESSASRIGDYHNHNFCASVMEGLLVFVVHAWEVIMAHIEVLSQG